MARPSRRDRWREWHRLDGQVFVSGASGVYRVGPNGGVAEAAVQIDKYVRTLPDTFQQQTVANGLAFDANGVLYVADTARGAIWKAVIRWQGRQTGLLAQSPLLEGVDGLLIAVARSGLSK